MAGAVVVSGHTDLENNHNNEKLAQMKAKAVIHAERVADKLRSIK